MIIVAGGVNNYSPAKEILAGTPHHVCDLIVKKLEEGHALNKQFLKNSIAIYHAQLVIGKSYGAWVAAEVVSKQPLVLFGLPLKEGEKSHSLPKMKTEPFFFYGKSDPYFDAAIIGQHTLTFFNGDHSFRPLTPSKIKAIRKKVLEVLHEEKPKQGTRPSLFIVRKSTDFKQFLSFFLSQRKQAKVSIVGKTKAYSSISLEECRQGMPTAGTLLDPAYGPITAVVKRRSFTSKHVYQANILDTAKIYPGRICIASGGLGVGEKKIDAMKKAIYEALERYSLALAVIDTINCKYDEIPETFRVDRKELIFTKDLLQKKMDWTVIRNAVTGEEKLYPAHLITPAFPWILRECTSTGTAFSTTKEEALAAGLRETIERNTLVRWFYGFPDVQASSIDLSSFADTEVQRRAVELTKKGFALKAFVLEFLQTNTAFIIAYDRTQRFGIGSACGPASEAILKALEECMITYDFAESLAYLTPKRPQDIKNLAQHYLYYQKERLHLLLTYAESISKGKPVCHKEYSYEKTIERLTATGFRTYWKDITAPEVRAAGFITVKVIVFGFLDMLKNHNLPWKKYYPLRSMSIPQLPLPFA